jgi:hypothetical protein
VEWAHDERSKINPVADGMKMFGEIVKVRWNSICGRYREAQFAPAAVAKDASLV